MDPNQQQLLLGHGSGASDPVYVDDVFSTYIKSFHGSTNIVNNIDLAGEGGLVWTKIRDNTDSHYLADTVNGVNKTLMSNSSNALANNSYAISAFNNNGFTYNDGYGGPKNYATWTFRKQKGFFDIVEYAGSGSYKTVAHNLGCIPGMYMIKRTDTNGNWIVHQKDLGSAKMRVLLNTDEVRNDLYSLNDNVGPTSSVFSVGSDSEVNASGGSYICYLFAGGYSSDANAKSVDFDGQEGIDVPASSSLNLGTSTFTIEGWMYLDDAPGTGAPSYGRFFQLDGPTVNSADTNLQITVQPQASAKAIYVQQGANMLMSGLTYLRTGWVHIALTRQSNTLRMYINGIQEAIASTAQDFNPNGGSPRVRLGYADAGTNNGVFNGKISNFRITTNQVLYTSNFKPPTTPLTTTSQGATASNVKLLCCNSSSVTGATVTPGTITTEGSPTASSASPFSDPESSKFGENEDQDIIKTGKYIGHTSGKFEVNLGWEPQFVMFKRLTGGVGNWSIFDSMRGIITKDSTGSGDNGNDHYLYPNGNWTEYSAERISLTPTGFKVDTGAGVLINGDTDQYIYMAIRRPDGLVGKPAAAGTDVWSAMYGNTNNTTPTFVSGFVTDFGFFKEPASGGTWYSQHRLTGTGYMIPSNANAEATSGNNKFDYMNGFYAATGNWSASMNWLWKRHAGFDVVTYKGNNSSDIMNGLSREIPHSLGRTPEMICVKRRSASEDWTVYHSGMGSPAINYHMQWNNNNARADASGNSHYVWGGVAPDATHFSVGGSANPDRTNSGTSDYVAMLFASVTGISKVGSYSGNGSTNLTITTGFQPRFLLIKRSDGNGAWHLFDSVRGMGATDKLLQLDSNSAQLDVNYVTVSSTGWNTEGTSLTNGNYIYYAHA